MLGCEQARVRHSWWGSVARALRSSKTWCHYVPGLKEWGDEDEDWSISMNGIDGEEDKMRREERRMGRMADYVVGDGPTAEGRSNGGVVVSSLKSSSAKTAPLM